MNTGDTSWRDVGLVLRTMELDFIRFVVLKASKITFEKLNGEVALQESWTGSSSSMDGLLSTGTFSSCRWKQVPPELCSQH